MRDKTLGAFLIGKLEGKLEGEKLKGIEITKSLLDILDDETIALKTGLDVEEIKKELYYNQNI